MIHKAKKSLGQNFLKSKPALNMMCSAGEVNEKDIILEIGPGKGALTEKLLKKVEKVIAVEKDRGLVIFLIEKFKNEIENGKLELIEGDILGFNIVDYLLPTTSYKLIANIPYNITGAILKKFLAGDPPADGQPTKMVLLVQKEVAERIVARDGKESILSLSVKAYGEPKYIMKVSKRFFSPQPKVDSAIIVINNISRKKFAGVSEKKFFEVVRAGFAHKRKVLIKNLEVGLPDIRKSDFRNILERVFEELGTDKKARAENVPIEKWLEIAKRCQRK